VLCPLKTHKNDVKKPKGDQSISTTNSNKYKKIDGKSLETKSWLLAGWRLAAGWLLAMGLMHTGT